MLWSDILRGISMVPLKMQKPTYPNKRMMCISLRCENLRLLDSGVRKRHDDVIRKTHFPRYWPFVLGIHRSPVNSPHKGQWRGSLMFSLICVWINGWVNNREACDLRRHRAHYDVIVMFETILSHIWRRYIHHIVWYLYSVVTWALKRIKWPTIRRLVKQLVKASNDV